MLDLLARAYTRFASPLARLLLGVLLALPLACLHVDGELAAGRLELAVAGAVLECPTGSLGCPCTAGGGCDPGLVCVSGYCDYGGGNGAAGGEYDYEFAEDLAPPPAPAPVMERSMMTESIVTTADSRRSRRADRKASRKSKGDASFAPAEATGAPAPTQMEPTGGKAESPTDALSGQTEEGESLATQGRQVIYTATLAVAVYDLDDTMAFAEAVPERWGGWIESRYDYQITLRVPAGSLFEIMDAFAERGDVLGKTLQADDVTAEYFDLESRIRVLEEIVAQLELLLKRATSVEEALKIRVQLDRLRIELKAARAQLRMLSELIDFSTLTLYLSPHGPAQLLPSSNVSFPWVDELGVEATEYR